MKQINFLLTFILVFFVCFGAEAQIFPGYNTSNYAGINSVDINPANIVDSRYQFDMNLFAANFIIENNYIGMNTSQIRNKQAWKGNFPDYGSYQAANLFERNLGSRPFSLYSDLKIQGPSAMLSITHKLAIGFSTEVRGIFNVDGVDANLAKISYYQLEEPSLWNHTYTSKNFSLREMSWADAGVDVGYVLVESGHNFLKVGAKLKYIQALNSIYLRANTLSWEFNNDHILNMNNPGTDFQYSHSENFDPGGSMSSASDYLKFNSKPTVGGDIGVVYEYRPHADKYKYDMNGQTGLDRNDKNKYKWKLGVSVTDIGWVKFDRPATVNNFNANLVNFDLNKFGVSGVSSFDDTVKFENSRFTQTSSKSTYRVELPTALSIQFDYDIYKSLYINATYLGDMTLANTDPAHVHQVSYLAITPRWDWKWFGVFVPFSYDGYHNFNTGLSVRMGPVVVGSGSILTLLTDKHIFGTDFHVAVKIPLLYNRPHDRDHDGVSNRKDRCPRDPGPWATRGCPDKDNDGVVDKDDECPDQPGPASLHGCPDSDGDGIADKDDSCPHEAGPIATHGCPDKDGDGVADKDDKCPDVAGSPAHHGCPDTDGDGVFDDVDKCPTVKGPPENNGCPIIDKPAKAPLVDTDHDGVPDSLDKCPTVPGSVEHQGCPDTDGDGVFDDVDKCPNVKGPPENNGCPVEKPVVAPTPPPAPTPAPVVENIRPHYDDVHFDLAKATIETSVIPELNELADLMKKHPTWQVALAGYTDNTGTPALNVALSQNRTLAVKQYLVSRGVKPAQVTTEWHGQDNPIGDNTTDAGRTQNRRVEVKLIQK